MGAKKKIGDKYPDRRAFFSTIYKADWTGKRWVREIRPRDSKHMALHCITFPGRVEGSLANEAGWYQQMGVYSGFFEGVRCRNKGPAHLYLPIDEELERQRPDNYVRDRDAALPVVEHDCLESFFEHIGYDPIKKRYHGRPDSGSRVD